MKRILLQPKNALLKQYTKLLELDKVNLKFEDNAIDYIIEKAVELKLGARGLRAIIEKIMTDIMFDAKPAKNKTLSITLDYVTKKCEQVFV